MHFAYWALLISGCDDIIFDPTTFGDVLYVPGVGGFIVDTWLIVMLHLNVWFIVTFMGL
jgi:hypothetical protein